MRKVEGGRRRRRLLTDPFGSGTLAHEVRILAGLEDPPYAIEDLLPFVLPDHDIQPTAETLPPGVLSVVDGRPGMSTIFYNRDLSEPDQRLVIMHAAAHVRYDRPPNTCFAAPNSVTGDILKELRAGAFALEVLCPLIKIHAELDGLDENSNHRLLDDEIDRCARLFNLPRHVIVARFHDLMAVYGTSFAATK